MPSQREMIERLQILEKAVARANEPYQQQLDIIQRRKERLQIAQQKLQYEEYLRRPGKSGEAIRGSLRSEIETHESVIALESRRAYRLKQPLKRRRKALREELRYYEEMAVLSRIPIPREIAEMISYYNYEGRFRDDD